jgi:hypothetical protein
LLSISFNHAQSLVGILEILGAWALDYNGPIHHSLISLFDEQTVSILKLLNLLTIQRALDIAQLGLVLNGMLPVEIVAGQDLWRLVGFLLIHDCQHFLRAVVLIWNGRVLLWELGTDWPLRDLREHWRLLHLLNFMVVDQVLEHGWFGDQIHPLLAGVLHGGCLEISILYVVHVILALIRLISLLEWSKHGRVVPSVASVAHTSNIAHMVTHVAGSRSLLPWGSALALMLAWILILLIHEVKVLASSLVVLSVGCPGWLTQLARVVAILALRCLRKLRHLLLVKDVGVDVCLVEVDWSGATR